MWIVSTLHIINFVTTALLCKFCIARFFEFLNLLYTKYDTGYRRTLLCSREQNLRIYSSELQTLIFSCLIAWISPKKSNLLHVYFFVKRMNKKYNFVVIMRQNFNAKEQNEIL